MIRRLQVMCTTGRMSYAWINARNVRAKLNRPQVCDDREAPYTKIRWRS